MRASTPNLIDAADPYEVLAIAPTASADEIKQAYFSQVKAHPPERDPAAFKRIRAAYEQLNSPEKRLETDMLRVAPWPLPEFVPQGELDITIDRADIVRAARACSDVDRGDWREDFRAVKL